MHFATQNQATEWAYSSDRRYSDPFNEVTLDILITDPDDSTKTVPAFWAGEQSWGVRYSSSKLGTHHFVTRCSDSSNTDLHGQDGTIEVLPYEGDNPLFRHGPLQVSGDCRYLQHLDGTPFFWLGDTWWLGLCKRLRWLEDLPELTADRVTKDFSLIQFVAGLYPGMDPFDERGANEAGFPWEKGFARINPVYFDMADLRVAHLVRCGLVPCIVGCWGYYLDFVGADVLKKHWRYLIARYCACPLVWCAAGEALMPFYHSPEFQLSTLDRYAWRDSGKPPIWSDFLGSIRAMDPYRHPLTIHPTFFGHDQVDDLSTMDIYWLQTGHSGHQTLTDTVNMLEEALAIEPRMPTLVSEANYDGGLETSGQEVQRFFFWSCLLAGPAGHTFGVSGIWQVNTKEQPFGQSSHGMSWGGIPWDEAYKLPGSQQLGIGKHVFERYPWWQFKAHPEWIKPHHSPDNWISCYASVIPGQVRVFYIPVEHLSFPPTQRLLIIKDLEPGLSYRAYYMNPKTGNEHDLGAVGGDEHGDYLLPLPPIFQDWVVVFERWTDRVDSYHSTGSHAVETWCSREGHVSALDKMLPEFYKLRGWDEQGKPTPEKNGVAGSGRLNGNRVFWRGFGGSD